MDKRSTQMSLPLQVEDKELKTIVRQHWNITFSRQGKISVIGKRIIALVLAQIQDSDLKLKDYYQMRSSDVMQASDIKGKSAYTNIKNALDELATQFWSIEDLEKKIYRPKQIMNTSTMESKEGFEYGYKEGLITIVINPNLEPYFVAMAHYSKWEIKEYMKFKSWYSMRLWEIFSAFKDKSKYHVTLEKFREHMDCETTYKDTNMLIKKTLAEPLEELKNTDLAFDFKKIYGTSGGRGRPPVIGLEFHFLKKLRTPKETLSKWSNYSERHGRLIKTAIETWKIKEKHLVTYLQSIGIEDFAKMIKEFEHKEQSSKRIDSKENYCNAVFVRTGKKAMKINK